MCWVLLPLPTLVLLLAHGTYGCLMSHPEDKAFMVEPLEVQPGELIHVYDMKYSHGCSYLCRLGATHEIKASFYQSTGQIRCQVPTDILTSLDSHMQYELFVSLNGQQFSTTGWNISIIWQRCMSFWVLVAQCLTVVWYSDAVKTGPWYACMVPDSIRLSNRHTQRHTECVSDTLRVWHSVTECLWQWLPLLVTLALVLLIVKISSQSIVHM